MEDIEFYENTEKRTKNAAMIRKAFYAGFNSGVAFLHECEHSDGSKWRREAFKHFIKQYKIKM